MAEGREPRWQRDGRRQGAYLLSTGVEALPCTGKSYRSILLDAAQCSGEAKLQHRPRLHIRTSMPRAIASKGKEREGKKEGQVNRRGSACYIELAQGARPVGYSPHRAWTLRSI